MNCSRRPGLGLQPLKDVGHWLAKKHPTLPVLPTVWRLKDTYIPLDRSSRLALAAGYDAAGGRLLSAGPHPLRSDLEARYPELVGDPRVKNFRPELRFQDWKDQAHGTF